MYKTIGFIMVLAVLIAVTGCKKEEKTEAQSESMEKPSRVLDVSEVTTLQSHHCLHPSTHWYTN